MADPVYSRFGDSALILRDELAIDRTVLANERTLLAYLRSGVALLIAGVSIMNLAAAPWFRWVGAVCLELGLAAVVIGVVRYRAMSRAIAVVRRQVGAPGPEAGR